MRVRLGAGIGGAIVIGALLPASLIPGAALGSSTVPLEEDAVDAAIQTDGKVVVAAWQVGYIGEPDRISVTRLNADGSLDTSFGDSGYAEFGGPAPNEMVPTDLAIQPDGKIVVVGSRGTYLFNSVDTDMLVLRLEPDGDLDPSFGGGDGRVTLDGGTWDEADAVAVQPDGKVVVGGSFDFNTGNACAVLVRMNSDGTLDTDADSTPLTHFDASQKDGIVCTDAFGGNWAFVSSVNAIAVQDDGKLVTHHGSQFLGRLTDVGAPDPSFGGLNGMHSDALPSGQFVGYPGFIDSDIAIYDGGPLDDKIVVAADRADCGSGICGHEHDVAVGRLNPDGTLDSTTDTDPGVALDGDGWLTLELGSTVSDSIFPGAVALGLKSDGSATLASHSGAGFDFGVARIDSAGALDAGFGSGGIRLVDFGAMERVGGLAISGDGKVVVGGNTGSAMFIGQVGLPARSDFAVARLDSAGDLDPGFSSDGKAVFGQTETVSVIEGTSGNDQVQGTAGNDVIKAGAGNDVINGGGGNDTIIGGPGNDTLNGDGAAGTAAATVRSKKTGKAGNDTLIGGGGKDRLNGGPGKDKLKGGPGNDFLLGGAGLDLLLGGPGKDKLNGGPGRDKEKQ